MRLSEDTDNNISGYYDHIIIGIINDIYIIRNQG